MDWPTAASKTGKDGKPTPSDVKITVTTAGKSSITYLVKLTVDPLPAWAVGTFSGECRVESGELGLVGLARRASRGGFIETALPKWQVTFYAPPKKGFAGWCETFEVKLIVDGQDIVTVVALMPYLGYSILPAQDAE